jgi:hypothetical protein
MGLASLGNAPHSRQDYEPLERVTKPNVSTTKAAYYLDRKPDTLQRWAKNGNGPIKPLRINNRLAWPVDQLKRLLGVSK